MCHRIIIGRAVRDRTQIRGLRYIKIFQFTVKISQEEYYEATKEEIALNRPKKSDTEKINSSIDTYTYDCATRALMEQEGFQFKYYFDSDKEKKSYGEAYDELYSACQKKLFSGGYKIYTTIDMA